MTEDKTPEQAAVEEQASERFMNLDDDDPRKVAEIAKQELEWCAKETGYLRTETRSSSGAKRAGRIRDRLEDIDDMLAYVGDQASEE